MGKKRRLKKIARRAQSSTGEGLQVILGKQSPPADVDKRDSVETEWDEGLRREMVEPKEDTIPRDIEVLFEAMEKVVGDEDLATLDSHRKKILQRQVAAEAEKILISKDISERLSTLLSVALSEKTQSVGEDGSGWKDGRLVYTAAEENMVREAMREISDEVATEIFSIGEDSALSPQEQRQMEDRVQETVVDRWVGRIREKAALSTEEGIRKELFTFENWDDS